MKKSIKKHIKVDTIIKPRHSSHFYMVTKLMNNKFNCVLITDDDEWKGWEEEFYYNIDMKVYNFVATNY